MQREIDNGKAVDRLRSGKSEAFLAEEDGELVGALLFHEDGAGWFIELVAVRFEHHRRGIARILMESAINEFGSLCLTSPGECTVSWLSHRQHKASKRLSQALNATHHREHNYYQWERNLPGESPDPPDSN